MFSYKSLSSASNHYPVPQGIGKIFLDDVKNKLYFVWPKGSNSFLEYFHLHIPVYCHCVKNRINIYEHVLQIYLISRNYLLIC